jgi:hypothetical protein
MLHYFESTVVYVEKRRFYLVTSQISIVLCVESVLKHVEVYSNNFPGLLTTAATTLNYCHLLHCDTFSDLVTGWRVESVHSVVFDASEYWNLSTAPGLSFPEPIKEFVYRQIYTLSAWGCFNQIHVIYINNNISLKSITTSDFKKIYSRFLTEVRGVHTAAIFPKYFWSSKGFIKGFEVRLSGFRISLSGYVMNSTKFAST